MEKKKKKPSEIRFEKRSQKPYRGIWKNVGGSNRNAKN